VRPVAKISLSIAVTLVTGLIILVILGIIFRPTVTADSSAAVKLAIIIGETIGMYLSLIGIVGGISAGYLAVTSPQRKYKVVYAIASFLMLALSILMFVYSSGHLPLS